MIPAKYGQITFIFFVSIGISCVESSVSVLNMARFVITCWVMDDRLVEKLDCCISELYSHRPNRTLFVDKLLIKE